MFDILNQNCIFLRQINLCGMTELTHKGTENESNPDLRRKKKNKRVDLKSLHNGLQTSITALIQHVTLHIKASLESKVS